MAIVPLTAGRLTSLWLVLRSLARLGGSVTSAELLGYASRSSLRSGALPIRDGLRLASQGALIRESGQRLELTDLGLAGLALGTEDEPSVEARRFFVSILLLTDPPAWVAYWQGDPSALDLVLPQGERRTLLDLELLPSPQANEDLRSWAFWQALRRVPLVAATAAQRKIIGDAGEELSLAYERRRLQEEDLPDLAARVQWVSRESDAYGFDILSFKGRRGSKPDENLAIEVKSSALPRGNWIHFFLSAHEWEMAAELGERYVVHVWTRVDPGPPPVARDDGPLLVQVPELVRHLPRPTECADRCQWQVAEIYYPADS